MPREARRNPSPSALRRRSPSPSQPASGIYIPIPWSEAADSITFDSPASSPPIAFLCGPKNSGKSTFSRHLVNTLLRRHKRVAYLDTDVGQPEFTPPGCLSLHVLHEQNPDLSVVSLKTPVRCLFFGDISSKRDPEAYKNSISCIYDYFYEEYRSSGMENPGRPMLPLVVNTPGWVKGIGYDLLVEMLNFMEPTHVVQIRTSSETKNLPTGVFWSNDSQKDFQEDGSQKDPPVLIYLRPACTDSFNQSVLIQKPAQGLRDIRVIAYFQQCIPSDLNVSTHKELVHALASIPPYEVPISGVKVMHLHCQVPSSEIFHSLNATIVGLAVSPGDSTDFSHRTPWCVGLGIIRGVDISKDLLYVITPVPLCRLEKVDLLLQGFIEIPTCLLQAPGCTSPYMSTNVLNKLNPWGMAT